jgi:hypothetical protein
LLGFNISYLRYRSVASFETIAHACTKVRKKNNSSTLSTLVIADVDAPRPLINILPRHVDLLHDLTGGFFFPRVSTKSSTGETDLLDLSGILRKMHKEGQFRCYNCALCKKFAQWEAEPIAAAKTDPPYHNEYFEQFLQLRYSHKTLGQVASSNNRIVEAGYASVVFYFHPDMLQDKMMRPHEDYEYFRFQFPPALSKIKNLQQVCCDRLVEIVVAEKVLVAMLAQKGLKQPASTSYQVVLLTKDPNNKQLYLPLSSSAGVYALRTLGTR